MVEHIVSLLDEVPEVENTEDNKAIKKHDWVPPQPTETG
jgi:hypothetical protein